MWYDLPYVICLFLSRDAVFPAFQFHCTCLVSITWYLFGRVISSLLPLYHSYCLLLAHQQRITMPPESSSFAMDMSSLRQYYDSYDTLFEAVQTSAKAQGFAIRKLRSMRPYKELSYTRVDLCCVCEGVPRPGRSTQRRSQQATLRCNCKFTAKAMFCHSEKA